MTKKEILINKLQTADFSLNEYRKNNNVLFDGLIDIIINSYNFKHIQGKIFKNEELLNWINEITPRLYDDKFNLSTKIYWIINDLHDFPRCENENCSALIEKNVSLYGGYSVRSLHIYCSHKCSVSSAYNKE